MSTENPRQFSPKTLLVASIGVAILTIVLKLLAWYVTDSVGLLSDALESFVNLASAVFALAMVTISQRPADDDHPYGHHKAEYFSAGFEGLLILGAALAIIVAAIERWHSPHPLEAVGLGLGLSIASTALNGLLAMVMFRAARRYRALGHGGAIAVEADAKHLVTDVWTSVGVVVGIAGVSVTGWLWLDPLVAIGVALNILYEGCRLVWQSARGLMDEAIEPEVMQTVHATLTRFQQQHPRGGTVRFDHIVSRQAGQRRFVDLHMHVPDRWTMGHAAAARGEVERALMDAVPGLRATIQLLPSDVEAVAVEDGPH